MDTRQGSVHLTILLVLVSKGMSENIRPKSDQRINGEVCMVNFVGTFLDLMHALASYANPNQPS